MLRLKNHYRYHSRRQSSSPATPHQLLRAVLPTQRLPAGEFTLDMDPFSML